MRKEIKTILLGFVVIIIAFFASFFKLGNTHFVLSIPFLILITAYKSLFFFYGLVGMMLASFFIEPNYLPYILMLSVILTFIFMMIIKRTKLNLKTYFACLGAVISVSINWMQSINRINNSMLMIDLIVIPSLVYFLCYYIIEFQLDMRSKETFSITKKELAFLAFLANLVLSGTYVEGMSFQFGLIISLIVNYLIIKLDPVSGLLACSTGFIFNIQHGYLVAISTFLPFMFAIRQLNISKYFGLLVYLITNAFFGFYFKDYSYLLEIGFVMIFILFYPKKRINFINKYIVEPQDYELKLYQQSYYRCLNNNKKIQGVMGILEKQLELNPRMRKSTKNVILENLQFLSRKLNADEDIHLKQKISEELYYKNANVLSFKLCSDYLSNYIIHLEVRHSAIDDDKIMEILESNLGVRLRKKQQVYNYLTDTYKYQFVNDERNEFNVAIRQRSKDSVLCGDSYVRFSIKNKKYVLISDGMGHGVKAGKDSSAALFLLKNFIELGMTPENSIKSCNALILDKEKECFNTLDLLEYDLFENKIYLYKNGSGATYLKSKNNVKRINSENLPLGIIEDINVEKININTDTDYIVLTSDGLRKDLKELLINTKIKSAKSLVNAILENEGNVIEDDQTIVVINVIKK